MTARSALAALTPDSVRAAIGLVRDGRVFDLAVELDPRRLPSGDPVFNRPFERADLLTPAAWRERVDSGASAFHLDMFGGSIHQGSHIDGLAHVVHDGFIHGGVTEAAARSEHGWIVAGIETVPPIVTRGVLIDLVAARHGQPLTGSEEIAVDELARVAAERAVELRPGDAVLLRTGKIRELDRERERFLERQPGIGVDAAVWLAERGMAVYGSDTGGTEPQPVADWDRTVHVELLTRRGIHLIEWLDLDELGRALGEAGRTDFLFVATPLKISGATGSWIRPIAVL